MRSTHLVMVLLEDIEDGVVLYNTIYLQVQSLVMWSSLSGILAILFMDKLEKKALFSDLYIGPYRRYVDVIYMHKPPTNQTVMPFTIIGTTNIQASSSRLRSPFHTWGQMVVITWLHSPPDEWRQRWIKLLQEEREETTLCALYIGSTETIQSQHHPQGISMIGQKNMSPDQYSQSTNTLPPIINNDSITVRIIAKEKDPVNLWKRHITFKTSDLKLTAVVN